jgi:hypothetical protein
MFEYDQRVCTVTTSSFSMLADISCPACDGIGSKKMKMKQLFLRERKEGTEKWEAEGDRGKDRVTYLVW